MTFKHKSFSYKFITKQNYFLKKTILKIIPLQKGTILKLLMLIKKIKIISIKLAKCLLLPWMNIIASGLHTFLFLLEISITLFITGPASYCMASKEDLNNY